MLLGNLLYQLYSLMNSHFMLTGPDPVADLIRTSGYPVERHDIATKDGYIVCLHRIPPRHAENSIKQKPVLLGHALMASGGQFVVNGNKSLGFMLADHGHDVWILHARGTSYSLKHKTLSNKDPKFWDFSWHEIGLYDVRAAIDFILQETGEKKVYFVGHSQGPTLLMVLLCMMPEYNEKLAAAYLLQPAALVHSSYPIFKHLVDGMVNLAKENKFDKILMKNSFTMLVAQNSCGRKPLSLFCMDMAMFFFGGNTGQYTDKHRIMTLSQKYVYDNVSMKQLVHYGQVHGSKAFRRFDYGPQINRGIYNGSSTPPEYDLSLVTVPTIVMYGTKDALTTATDIKLTIKKMPNVKEVIELPWNHGDLIFGKDSHILHNQIIESMEKYS